MISPRSRRAACGNGGLLWLGKGRLLAVGLAACGGGVGDRDASGQPAPNPPASDASRCSPPEGQSELRIRNQDELEALRGCAVVHGHLRIEPFEAVDLTPLAALEIVEGTFTLGDTSDEVPKPGIPSLAGLEALRQTSDLQLIGVTAPSLETLRGLTRMVIGPDGFVNLRVLISGCPELTDLRGLENLTGFNDVMIVSNPKLKSVSGLTVPPELRAFSIADSPVRDLTALGSLTAVPTGMSFFNTDLRDLSGLEGLTWAGWLQIKSNPALFDASGLRSLRTAEYLDFVDNAALEALPEAPELSKVVVLTVVGNAALREMPEWPRVERLDTAIVSDNPRLSTLRTLSAVTSANRIDVDGNPELVVLSLDRLERVERLRVVHNAQLDSTLVRRPDGVLTVGANRDEATLLDPCPWSGNGYCEAMPEDDLCAPGTDSDCSD